MSKEIPFFPSQHLGIDFLLEGPKRAIFARPGRGKTRIALEAIHATGAKTLVIAPKLAAMTVWPAENKKWGYDMDMRFIHGPGKSLGSEQISVINYDALHWLAEQDLSSYDYVVYDELTKLKHPGTMRWKRWRKKMKGFRFTTGLTGTPSAGKYQDLWGQLYAIDQGATLGTAKYKYIEKYFRQFPYDKYRIEPVPGALQAIDKELAKTVLSLDYLTDELPERQKVVISTPLSGRIRQRYDEFAKKGVSKKLGLVADNPGVKFGKLRQLCSGAYYTDTDTVRDFHEEKINALRDLIDGMHGAPLLVFYYYDHELTRMQKMKKAPVLNGDTPTKDIPKIVAKFNEGKHAVLYAHPKTASMGGNFQHACSALCWFTPPLSSEDAEQGRGRVWRSGQKNSVTEYFLIVPDSADSDRLEILEDRIDIEQALFDNLKRG